MRLESARQALRSRALLKATTMLGAGLLFLGTPAFGQVGNQPLKPKPPVPATADSAPKEREIIITGSALPVSPGAIAVPVSVISSEAMAKSGVNTNVLEILRKSLPVFGGRSSTGNSNAANTNQNTAGGSSIQIRNLDTLILVDGRRVAADSIAGVNGKVFVNVAEIPPAAIERIEVLTDGASAIYGSEAIGGVVNIILKSRYEGGLARARYGAAAGHYNEKSVDLTYGFDPFRGTNLTFAASYSQSSPLFQNQRSFSSPFYSTATTVPGAIGNFFLNPGITAPTPALAATIGANPQYTNAGATIATAPGSGIGGTYDLSPFQMLLLKQKQKGGVVTLRSDLTGDRSVELFVDLQYTQNNSYTQFAPVVAPVTAPAGSPFDPLTTASTVVFGSTTNPKTYVTDYKAYRGTAGLRGNFGMLGQRWNWEAGYTHSENKIHQEINNAIFTPNLARAVAGGFNSAGVAIPGGAFSQVFGTTSISGPMVFQPALNPFARAVGVTPGALSNVLVQESLHGTSKVDSVDGKLAGGLFKLPAGPLSLAVGVAWRREAISGSVDDPNAYSHIGGKLVVGATGTQTGASQSLFTGGLISDPFSSSRTITSQFGEIRVPVTSADWNIPGFYALDLIGAIRHEHYSDFGDATVPKIGFRWQPVPRVLTFRGNYARSFTAPSLYQIGGPLNVGTTASNLITNAFPTAIPGSATQQSGSNPNLKPAKSRSISLGAVITPPMIKRLTLDVEYSATKETGQIAGIGLTNILFDVNAHGSASPFFQNASTNALPGQTGAVYFQNAGDLLKYLTNPANLTGGVYGNLFLKDIPTNLGLLNIKSMNFTLNYSLPTREGLFSLSSQAAWLLQYKFQAIPGQPIFDFKGTTTSGGNALGTLPKLRTYTVVDWSKGHWTAGIANSYISSVKDIGTGGFPYYTNLAANPTQFAAGHVKSYMTWDVRAGFRSEADGEKGFSLDVGINNLFDRMPPVSTNIDPSGGHAAGATAWRAENNADLSTYSPLGRLFWGSIGYRF